MERRYFLGTVLMTSAFAHLGTIRTVEAGDRAPREFSALGRAVDWINSAPLTPEHLAGKVVLVNVWTYTCINWLRTLPYVRAWAQKYQQQLVVVGVHTPEFPFERNIDNVRRAVRQMNIEYPVAIDNDYSIWRAFDNHYWPALYFVDSRGRVRGHRFGEGEYDKSEQLIQRLLAEMGAAGVGDSLVAVDASGVEAPADWSNLRSPENDVGYERTENFASPGGAALIDAACMPPLPGWRSINGRWLATGPWAGRLPS
jgi:thiol-disulfide isomerase/thioredoxin